MCRPCGISISLVAAEEDAECFFLRPSGRPQGIDFPLLGYNERSQLIGFASIHRAARLSDEQRALRIQREPKTGAAQYLTVGLKGLPSNIALPAVFRSLLGNQILATQRLGTGLADRTKPRRLAADAMSIIHRPAFLR
jgi:hypothetical protein